MTDPRQTSPATTPTEGSTYGTDEEGRLCVRRLRVRVLDGPDRGGQTVVDEGSLIVGAGSAADFSLTDDRVSRVHLELASVGGRIRARDLESRDGCFLGDTRFKAVHLTPPAEIRIGRSLLEVGFDDEPAPTLPSDQSWFGAAVGHGSEMRRLFAALEQVAPTATSVLLEGEPGVGKTLIGRALHRASRREGALVVLACGETHARAIPKAAAAAAQGTLLIEDVDRLEPDAAEVLVDALCAGTARTVATSRHDVQARVSTGLVSRELYFQTAAVRMRIPPLRDRPEDLRAIAVSMASTLGFTFRPGRSFLERAHADALRENGVTLMEMVRGELASEAPKAAVLPGYKEARQAVVDAFERDFVERLLARHAGNVSRAAEEAGISRNHLTSLVKKHGLR